MSSKSTSHHPGVNRILVQETCRLQLILTIKTWKKKSLKQLVQIISVGSSRLWSFCNFLNFGDQNFCLSLWKCLSVSNSWIPQRTLDVQLWWIVLGNCAKSLLNKIKGILSCTGQHPFAGCQTAFYGCVYTGRMERLPALILFLQDRLREGKENGRETSCFHTASTRNRKKVTLTL